MSTQCRSGGHFEFQYIQMQTVRLGGRGGLRTVRSNFGMQALLSLWRTSFFHSCVASLGNG